MDGGDSLLVMIGLGALTAAMIAVGKINASRAIGFDARSS